MNSEIETKTYKVAILPARPTKGLENKEVTKQMIDGALAYDPKIKRAFMYKNAFEAHGRSGLQNVETVAEFKRTFLDKADDGQEYVFAEVKPNRVYAGARFEELLETFPMRSADLWPKSAVPGARGDFYLVSCALCGSQPSILNLPAVTYSTQIGSVHFAVNVDLKRAEAEEFINKHLPLLTERDHDEAVQLSCIIGDKEKHLDALKAHFGLRDKPVTKPAQLAVDAPEDPNSAINRFATENNISIDSTSNFERAERGAMGKWPAVFGIKEFRRR